MKLFLATCSSNAYPEEANHSVGHLTTLRPPCLMKSKLAWRSWTTCILEREIPGQFPVIHICHVQTWHRNPDMGVINCQMISSSVTLWLQFYGSLVARRVQRSPLNTRAMRDHYKLISATKFWGGLLIQQIDNLNISFHDSAILIYINFSNQI